MPEQDDDIFVCGGEGIPALTAYHIYLEDGEVGLALLCLMQPAGHGWVCTRLRGHEGRHVADSHTEMAAYWEPQAGERRMSGAIE